MSLLGVVGSSVGPGDVVEVVLVVVVLEEVEVVDVVVEVVVEVVVLFPWQNHRGHIRVGTFSSWNKETVFLLNIGLSV